MILSWRDACFRAYIKMDWLAEFYANAYIERRRAAVSC